MTPFLLFHPSLGFPTLSLPLPVLTLLPIHPSIHPSRVFAFPLHTLLPSFPRLPFHLPLFSPLPLFLRSSSLFLIYFSRGCRRLDYLDMRDFRERLRDCLLQVITRACDSNYVNTRQVEYGRRGLRRPGLSNFRVMCCRSFARFRSDGWKIRSVSTNGTIALTR